MGLMAASVSVPAQAAVIFDTLYAPGVVQSSNTPSRIASPGSLTGPVQQGGPLGVSFSIGYTQNITSVTLRLRDDTPGDGGSVMVFLVNDAGGSPADSGSGLGYTMSSPILLGSILDSALSASSATDVTINPNLAIGAGNYWLMVTNGHPTVPGLIGPASDVAALKARWYYETNFSTGIGISGQSNFGQYSESGEPGTPIVFSTPLDPFGALPAISGFYMAQINDAPEPATLAIVGASLIGLGLARRRKKAAAAN
jgi:hypothetical protein